MSAEVRPRFGLGIRDLSPISFRLLHLLFGLNGRVLCELDVWMESYLLL